MIQYIIRFWQVKKDSNNFKKSSSAELNMNILFLACSMVMYCFIIFHLFHVWSYTTHNLTYIQTRQWKYIQTFKKIPARRMSVCFTNYSYNFLCNWKILLLSGSPPHRVRPYLKWTWKHAKYMVLKTYGLITFFKELIIQ